MASRVVSFASFRRRRGVRALLFVPATRRETRRWWTGLQFGAPAASEVGRGTGARC